MSNCGKLLRKCFHNLQAEIKEWEDMKGEGEFCSRDGKTDERKVISSYIVRGLK